MTLQPTDNLQLAIDRATERGAPTILKLAGQHLLHTSITLRPGVGIAGGRLIAVRKMPYMVHFSGQESQLHDMALDANNLVKNAVFRINSTKNIKLSGLSLMKLGSANGIEISHAYNVSITDSRFDGGGNGLELRGPVLGLVARAIQFREWSNHAVYVVGTPQGASSDVLLDGLDIGTPNSSVVGPKQPIAFQTTNYRNDFHRRLRIVNCKIYGFSNHPEGAWSIRLNRKRPTANTSDQISLHASEHFVIENNQSLWGGELGLFVGVGSRLGRIVGNTVAYNDIAGISVGATGSGVLRTTQIVVEDNYVHDNGRDIDGNARLNRAGLWIDSSDNILVQNNFSGNRYSQNQLFGLRVRNSWNVRSANNHYLGNIIANENHKNSRSPSLDIDTPP